MLAHDQVLLALDDPPLVPTLPPLATTEVLQCMADLMTHLATGHLPETAPEEDDDEIPR